MSWFQVVPGELERVGGELTSVGQDVGALEGNVASLGALSAPPATAASLDRFRSRRASRLGLLGDAVVALGRGAGTAGGLYRTVDSQVMPGGLE